MFKSAKQRRALLFGSGLLWFYFATVAMASWRYIPPLYDVSIWVAPLLFVAILGSIALFAVSVGACVFSIVAPKRFFKKD